MWILPKSLHLESYRHCNWASVKCYFVWTSLFKFCPVPNGKKNSTSSALLQDSDAALRFKQLGRWPPVIEFVFEAGELLANQTQNVIETRNDWVISCKKTNLFKLIICWRKIFTKMNKLQFTKYKIKMYFPCIQPNVQALPSHRMKWKQWQR